MGAGAILEPLLVVTLLVGGAWIIPDPALHGHQFVLLDDWEYFLQDRSEALCRIGSGERSSIVTEGSQKHGYKGYGSPSLLICPGGGPVWFALGS